MSKLYECIYAYICKNNYVGECSPADRIYTLTSGMSESEIDEVSAVLQAIGATELINVDSRRGVTLYPKDVEADFSVRSFTYLPAKNGGSGAFSCASLRKSLKNKDIRGSKELTHALIFDTVPDGFYVADLIKNGRFSRYSDIPLDESAAIEYQNEDLVCEVKPDELEKIEWEDFSSRPLSSGDVFSLGKKSLKVLSELAHAIVVSQSEKRTLYVVFSPEEYDEVVDYLIAALKLFPAKIANGLSFITALGKTSKVSVDICGVPTTDDEYISLLKREGNVVKITGFDAEYLGGEKGVYANFIQNATRDDFEGWLESLPRYESSVNSFLDMDGAVSLYANASVEAFDPENPEKFLGGVSSRIRVVTDKYAVISNIKGEAESQFKGLEKQIKEACGAFNDYAEDSVERLVVDPLLSLYGVCAKAKEPKAALVLSCLNLALFGLDGQSDALNKKHFEILSSCHKKVQKSLGENYEKFVEEIILNRYLLKRFFDAYLNEPTFFEASAELTLSFLPYLLKDIENCGREKASVRDYFVAQYILKNPDRFGDIVRLVFDCNENCGKAAFAYLLDFVLRAGGERRQIVEPRADYVCDYTEKIGLTLAALDLVKERYVRRFSEDETLTLCFDGLLKRYLAVEDETTLDDICLSFHKAEKLSGENSSAGLKKFIYVAFSSYVFEPKIIGALNKLRFEEVTAEREKDYSKLLEWLKRPEAYGIIPEKHVPEIEATLEKLSVFKTQTASENLLKKGRIDFVARELLLLKGKTIYKLLCEFIGEEAFKKVLCKEDIIEGKPYKNPKFLSVAEREAREFLLNGDNDKKLEFSEKIRAERKKVFRDAGVGTRDFIGGLLSSAIFAAVMAFIAMVCCIFIYKKLAGEYFKSLYLVFVMLVFVVCFVLYWTNFKDRRLRSNLMMSLWQSLLFLVVTLGLFTSTQVLLGLIIA